MYGRRWGAERRSAPAIARTDPTFGVIRLSRVSTACYSGTPVPVNVVSRGGSGIATGSVPIAAASITSVTPCRVLPGHT